MQIEFKYLVIKIKNKKYNLLTFILVKFDMIYKPADLKKQVYIF